MYIYVYRYVYVYIYVCVLYVYVCIVLFKYIFFLCIKLYMQYCLHNIIIPQWRIASQWHLLVHPLRRKLVNASALSEVGWDSWMLVFWINKYSMYNINGGFLKYSKRGT